MKQIKKYENIYGLYWNNQKIWLLLSGICVLLFMLAFVAIIFDAPFAVSMTLFLMIIPGVILGISSLVLRYLVKKSLARFTDAQLSRINNEIPLVQTKEGFCVTHDALICSRGRLFLYPVKDILWIYKQVTTTKMYGVIPMGKSSVLMIGGMDHKRYGCKTNNKGDIVEFLHAGLQPYRKGVFYGYSNELDRMFRKNFNRMVEMSKEQEMR